MCKDLFERFEVAIKGATDTSEVTWVSVIYNNNVIYFMYPSITLQCSYFCATLLFLKSAQAAVF